MRRFLAKFNEKRLEFLSSFRLSKITRFKSLLENRWIQGLGVPCSLAIFTLILLFGFFLIKPSGFLDIDEQKKVELSDLRDKASLIDAIKLDCGIVNLEVNFVEVSITPDDTFSLEDVFLRGLLTQCRLAELTGAKVKQVTINVRAFKRSRDVMGPDDEAYLAIGRLPPAFNNMIPSLRFELIADGKAIYYASDSELTDGKPSENSSGLNGLEDSRRLEEVVASAPYYLAQNFRSLRQPRFSNKLFHHLCGAKGTSTLTQEPFFNAPKYAELVLPIGEYTRHSEFNSLHYGKKNELKLAKTNSAGGLRSANPGYLDGNWIDSIQPLLFSENNVFEGIWMKSEATSIENSAPVEAENCTASAKQVIAEYRKQSPADREKYDCVTKPLNYAFQIGWASPTERVGISTIFISENGKIRTISVINKSEKFYYKMPASVECFNSISQASFDWRK